MSQLRSTSRAKVQEHCSALWVWVQGRSCPRACILIMTLQGLSGGDAALCSARQSQLTKLSTIFPSLSSVLITVAGRTLPSSFCASWTESTCWGQAVHFPPALGVSLLYFIYFYPRITLNLQEVGWWSPLLHQTGRAQHPAFLCWVCPSCVLSAQKMELRWNWNEDCAKIMGYDGIPAVSKTLWGTCAFPQHIAIPWHSASGGRKQTVLPEMRHTRTQRFVLLPAVMWCCEVFESTLLKWDRMAPHTSTIVAVPEVTAAWHHHSIHSSRSLIPQ